MGGECSKRGTGVKLVQSLTGKRERKALLGRQSVRRLSRKCGSLDISQHNGPPQPLTAVAIYIPTSSWRDA
jgi:hypothetical protein